MYADDDRRFEELESDSEDDGYGVPLEGKFRGDELHFTGADLSIRSKRRKQYDDSSSESLTETDEEGISGQDRTMQIALRDKEDLLVEKALQRIRRAQELGKTKVKLSQSELEALQRKREKTSRRAAQTKQQKRDRTSGTYAKPAKKEKVRERRSNIELARVDLEGSSSSRRPPGMVIARDTSVPLYAPLGYRPPAALPQPKTSRPGSRVPSSQNLKQPSPDLTRRGEKRIATIPAPRSPPSNSSSRSLPDDPNWMPRPRSSSSLTNPPYHSDPNYPYHYQAYSPPLPQIPAQYASPGRRIVSNPQPDSRDRLPRYEGLGVRGPRREHSAPESQRGSTSEASSDDVDDDSDDEGVSVDVVPTASGRGYEIRSVGEEGVTRERRGGRR